MSDKLQFYPTPAWLAKFAGEQFQEKVEYLLEPHAGKGDLLKGAGFINGYGGCCTVNIAAVEIDVENQEVLRGKKIDIVGHDFLKMTDATQYSHILMNPPFINGDEHLIHAWNILDSGEIVAIINAETIRNPYSAKRELLNKIISDNGYVVFIDDAFAKEHGAARPANVDVAVVYLKKVNEKMNFTFECKKDDERFDDADFNEEIGTQVGMPVGFIESYVKAFGVAVEALKFSHKARIASSKYANMLGENFLEELAKEQAVASGNLDYIIKTSFDDSKYDSKGEFVRAYRELKHRAWSSILRYSKVEDSLSSNNINLLRKEFTNISNLDFTSSNIYSFLLGFSQSRNELNNNMVLHVFDEISKFHPDNRLYYKGWKSNGWHRLNAFQVKSKRFILPISLDSFGFSYLEISKFSDFDQVFRFLDGKNYSNSGGNGFYGVADLLKEHDSSGGLARLSGNRISTEYFDVRLYVGAGTIHFFPKRKDLIERLNNLVGKLRQWLPDEPEHATKEFWEQHDQSERINKGFNVKTSNWELNSLFREAQNPDANISSYSKIASELSGMFDKAAKDLGINSGLSFDAKEQLNQMGGEGVAEQQLALPNLSNDDEAA